LNEYNRQASIRLYDDRTFSGENEAAQDDAALDKYINERRQEFYEEWFQYLKGFYD